MKPKHTFFWLHHHLQCIINTDITFCLFTSHNSDELINGAGGGGGAGDDGKLWWSVEEVNNWHFPPICTNDV